MNPAFRFARGGKVYKELEADEAHEIPGFIRTGIISPNDDYWTPGMGDWKKVSSGVWNHPAPVTGAANKPPTIQAAEAAQAAASLGSSDRRTLAELRMHDLQEGFQYTGQGRQRLFGHR
jgi:hypothetical protein